MDFLLVLLMCSGITAMESNEPFSKKGTPINHKIMHGAQYTTETCGNETFSFDLENPEHILINKPEGLFCYDSQRHQHGKCKVLPATAFYSMQTYHDGDNNMVLYSTINTITLWNRTTGEIFSTMIKQPSKLRFLGEKIGSFAGKTLDIFDGLEKSETIQHKSVIQDVIPVEGEANSVIIGDDTNVYYCDIRHSKIGTGYTHGDVYSAISAAGKIAVGTSTGQLKLFDKRKLAEPLLTRMLKKNKKVSVQFAPKSREFIAAYGDHVDFIDAQHQYDTKTRYHFPKLTRWDHNPDWLGCVYNNENGIALAWEGICDQEPYAGTKTIVSFFNLKKAQKDNDGTTPSVWQKLKNLTSSAKPQYKPVLTLNE